MRANNYKHCFYDGLVFKKIRSALGGRVRCMLTGSAPISDEVKNFFKLAMGCNMLEGYGLTETSGAGTITRIEDPSNGTVGGPDTSLELKLLDVPEMNYLSTDLDEYMHS